MVASGGGDVPQRCCRSVSGAGFPLARLAILARSVAVAPAGRMCSSSRPAVRQRYRRVGGQSVMGRSRWLLVGAGAVVVVLVVVLVVVRSGDGRPSSAALPLRSVGEVALPGDNSRFDYASLDADRGLLFVAHLGASEIIEIDVHAHRVVRTIPHLSQVHGVLVVPARHRVFAPAAGANTMV